MENKMVARVYAAWSTIIIRQGVFSIIALLFIIYFFNLQTAFTWFVGFAAGVLDSVVVFMGVKKGMKYPAQHALAIMHRNMLERMALLFLITFVMFRLDLNAAGLFLGFLLMHIFLLVNLIIITARNQQKAADVKKGE